jgi:hypothetical protein
MPHPWRILEISAERRETTAEAQLAQSGVARHGVGRTIQQAQRLHVFLAHRMANPGPRSGISHHERIGLGQAQVLAIAAQALVIVGANHAAAPSIVAERVR